MTFAVPPIAPTSTVSSNDAIVPSSPEDNLDISLSQLFGDSGSRVFGDADVEMSVAARTSLVGEVASPREENRTELPETPVAGGGLHVMASLRFSSFNPGFPETFSKAKSSQSEKQGEFLLIFIFDGGVSKVSFVSGVLCFSDLV